MEESILTSTKKVLGIDAEYKAFDLDVITAINTVFAILNQLGVGPDEGFVIEDDSAEWSAFYTDVKLSQIKSYVWLRVRIMFDPPASGFALESLKEQYKEMEWRLNVQREGGATWRTAPTS